MSYAVRPTKTRTPIIEIANSRAELFKKIFTIEAIRIAIKPIIKKDPKAVKSFLVEYWDGKTWQKLAESTTVGHKRLLRFPTVKSTQVKLTIKDALAKVYLAEFGVYKASAQE